MATKKKLKGTSAPRVLPVRPKQMTVKITKEDIKEAVERDPNKCVVACAIRRAHPELSHISVDIATIRATDKKAGIRTIWFTPPALQKVVVATDQGLREKIRPGKATALVGQVLQLPPKKRRKPTKPAASRRTPAKKKARLARINGGNNVPVVVGGVEPPKTLLGQTRSFGKRALRI